MSGSTVQSDVVTNRTVVEDGINLVVLVEGITSKAEVDEGVEKTKFSQGGNISLHLLLILQVFHLFITLFVLNTMVLFVILVISILEIITIINMFNVVNNRYSLGLFQQKEIFLVIGI